MTPKLSTTNPFGVGATTPSQGPTAGGASPEQFRRLLDALNRRVADAKRTIDYVSTDPSSEGLFYRDGRNPQAALLGVARTDSGLGRIASFLARQRNAVEAMRQASSVPDPRPPEGMYPEVPSMQAGGVPMPDLSSYVSPYDNAMAKVRDYSAAATPEINSAYDTLAKRLSGYAADAVAANEAAKAGVEQRLTAAASDVAAAYQANIDRLSQFGGSGLGSLTAGAMAEQEAAKAQFAAQQASQTNLLNQIGLQQQSAAQDRMSAADASRAQALTSKEVAMQAALSQLESGRAQAERQYASDAASASAANASAANAAARGNFEMAMQIAQAKTDYINQQQDAYKKSLISGKDWLYNEYAPIASQENPNAWNVFTELIGGANDNSNFTSSIAGGGTRAGSKAEVSDADRMRWAESRVDSAADELRNKNGVDIDRSLLRRWIRIYFTPGNTMLSSEKAAANGLQY